MNDFMKTAVVYMVWREFISATLASQVIASITFLAILSILLYFTYKVIGALSDTVVETFVEKFLSILASEFKRGFKNRSKVERADYIALLCSFGFGTLIALYAICSDIGGFEAGFILTIVFVACIAIACFSVWLVSKEDERLKVLGS